MANDSTSATRDFPRAIHPEAVGSYPALAKSGGGYFYDEVLEYRVWVHPERGGPDHHEGEDYFHAFESHDQALDFHTATPGSEEPLALVRQYECISEPEPGVFEHVTTERITEWSVDWLADSKREPDTIARFLEERGHRS